MRITITANTVKVEKRLKKIIDGVKDFKKPLKKSAKDAIFIYQGNFEKKGAEFGGWAKLAPSTIMAKARMGYPLTPLVATGQMKRAFRTLSLSKDTVVVGNETEYYPYHQLGTKNIPRRVMISLNAKLEKQIIDNFENFFKDLIYN